VCLKGLKFSFTTGSKNIFISEKFIIEKLKVVKMEVSDSKVRLVTVSDLALAILNSTPEMETLGYATARDLALYVLNFFGYHEQIIDNILEALDRNLFYLLEDAHILVSGREDVTLYTGREWRIHFWKINKRRIFELAKLKKHEKEVEKEEYMVYHEIPEEIWARA